MMAFFAKMEIVLIKSSIFSVKLATLIREVLFKQLLIHIVVQQIEQS